MILNSSLATVVSGVVLIYVYLGFADSYSDDKSSTSDSSSINFLAMGIILCPWILGAGIW
jgi:hypothetical protein